MIAKGGAICAGAMTRPAPPNRETQKGKSRFSFVAMSFDTLKPMRCLAAVMLVAWLSIIASPSHAQTELKKGAEILRTNCSSCHAIGRDDVSGHPQAPAFRTLSSRYPIEYLSEALGEGLSSGHPDMPDFIFKPEEVKAILAYLQSIQQAHKPGAK